MDSNHIQYKMYFHDNVKLANTSCLLAMFYNQYINQVFRYISPCRVMAKTLDCGLEVSEFELQLRYYVHFWTNALRKGMNSFISKANNQIVSQLFFNTMNIFISMINLLNKSL